LGLALGLRRRRWTGAALVVLLVTLLLVLGGRFGDLHGAEVHEGMLRAPEPAESMVVIQPDAPILPAAEAWQNYERLVDMSLEACSPPGRRRVIWPESAAFPLRYGASDRLHRDLARLHGRGCGVLLGSVRFEGERYFISVFVTDAAGVLGTYSKRKLVPWGEYIPLKSVLPFVGYLARNAGEFSAGEAVDLLPWGDQRIGMAVCYEVVFAGAVAEQVRAGATVLSTITNDAWYGDSAAPRQHFRAARFRAAENRRPLLRSALTGISALVDARGAVVRGLDVGERGVIEGNIRGRRDLSPFSRAPWAVPLGSVLLAAFAIVRARKPR
jgi:apolipoprotein N-acyltransferase